MQIGTNGRSAEDPLWERAYHNQHVSHILWIHIIYCLKQNINLSWKKEDSEQYDKN